MCALNLFVSPNGSDTWQGTVDRPFASLARARDFVRHLKEKEMMPAGGVTIHLREGTYYFEESFSLTSADSGTEEAPVVYQTCGDEDVHLTGGQRISGFRPVSDPEVRRRLDENARRHVLEVSLKDQGITDLGALTPRGFGRPVRPAHLELFFNGEPMDLARWPNHGFTHITGIPEEASHGDEHGGTLGDLACGFYYAGGRPAGWRHVDDVWVHGYWAWDWANTYEKVETIDCERHWVKTEPPYGLYGFRKGQRFYFLNVLEELDRPGEYYVDRKTGMLYFWPPAPVENGEATVSLLAGPLVSLKDTEHVSLRGFCLECTRGSAIEIEGGKSNTICGCTIRNAGNHGVNVKGGTGHKVAGCQIFQTGDSGIRVDGGDRKNLIPGGHVVSDNHIHHMGRWTRCYQPAVAVNGTGNCVSHNLIHDGSHNAIQLSGNDHLIEFNEIHHVCLETGDVGAFYMGRDWTERGNVIRHNFFHHIEAEGSGGSMAVYLDDCASGTLVYGNIFYRTTRAVFIGGGRDNIVDNNIFVDCHPAIMIDGRGLDDSPVWHNMVYKTMKERLDAVNYMQPPYSKRYPELAALNEYYIQGDGVPPEGNRVVRNVVCGGTWLKVHWHAREEMVDTHDNLTGLNPRFADPERMNFQLEDDSPAWTLGFRRIPIKEIGPRKKN